MGRDHRSEMIHPTPNRLVKTPPSRAGTGDAHHLVNETDDDVFYLEIGDRSRGDHVTYPDDDIAAGAVESGWRFVHKDGTPV